MTAFLLFDRIGDLLQIGAFRQAIHGLDGGILEGAVHRDRDKLFAIGQRGARGHADRFERGVACNRAATARVVDTAERELRDRRPRRRLGDVREDFGIGQRADGCKAVRFTGLFERFERDVAKHRRGVGSNAAVRVVAGDEREH